LESLPSPFIFKKYKSTQKNKERAIPPTKNIIRLQIGKGMAFKKNLGFKNIFGIDFR